MYLTNTKMELYLKNYKGLNYFSLSFVLIPFLLLDPSVIELNKVP